MAQATISGTVAVGYDSFSGKGSGFTPASQLGTLTKYNIYGFQTSNITIAATEDLGGGLRASAAMTLETSTNTDRGSSLNFADRNVSLAGGFGTVRFAQTRSTNLAVGANVASISLNQDQYSDYHKVFAGTPRAGITLLSYVSPELAKGLRVNVGLAMGNNQNNPTDTAAATAPQAPQMSTGQKERQTIVGATYAAGPLTAAIAVKSLNEAARTRGAALSNLVQSNSATAATIEKTVYELNATYDFGVARVGVGYASKERTTGKHATTFGVSAPVASNITVGLNYGKRDKAKYQDVGATYALSKRTSVSVAQGSYTTVTGVKYNQSRVRVAHTF